MTKRKVSISLEELLFLARERQATFALIEEKFGKPLEEVPEGGKANHNYEGLATIVHKNVLFGYYVLYVKNPDPEETKPLEIGVIQKFYDSVSFLVSKEYSLGMKIKYSEDFESLLHEVGAKQNKLNKKGMKRHQQKIQRKKEAKAEQEKNKGKQNDIVDKKTKL